MGRIKTVGAGIGGRRLMAGLAAVGLALWMSASGPAVAAEGAGYEKRSWSFYGIFGTYDRASMQRGFQVYVEVCAACHGLKRIAFRNLVNIGFNEAEAKAIAADYEIEDGPDQEGEMFTRPGRLADYFVSPFANDNAARASNNGALPPDLSLISKARKGGPDYLYALLVGYTEPPGGEELPDGMYHSLVFPGGQIAMPPPLFADAVEYADGTSATVPRMAEDLSHFLVWTAETKLEERKRLGLKVMIVLIILAGLLYAVKKRVWADLH